MKSLKDEGFFCGDVVGIDLKKEYEDNADELVNDDSTASLTELLISLMSLDGDEWTSRIILF